MQNTADDAPISTADRRRRRRRLSGQSAAMVRRENAENAVVDERSKVDDDGAGARHA